MKKTYVTLCFCLLSFILYGQEVSDAQRKDSLQAQLRQAKDENERATFLRLLALFYEDAILDSVLFYGDQLISTTEKLEDKTLLLDALGITSQSYIAKGNLPKALELCLRGELIQETNPELISNSEVPGIGPVYYSFCDIYYQLDDDVKLLKYAEKQLNLTENGLAKCLGNYWKAVYFHKHEKLDSALYYLKKSIEIIEVEFANDTRFDKFDFNPIAYNLLAKIYVQSGKPDLALAEFHQVLKVHIQREKNLPLAITYNDLAQFHKDNNSPDSSIFYAEKALEVSQKIGFVNGKMQAYNLLSENYELVDPTIALEYYKLSSEAEKSLYGSGNIQVLKDMISQKDKEAEALVQAQTTYQNRLKMYLLLSGLLALILVSIILYRSNKKSRASNEVLAKTLQNLKAAQAQLIQSEKMASLGELTAGIAHEIQNPLNFVNNFSEVTEELVEELEEEGNKENGERDKGLEKELISDIKDNLQKIHHHGNRASSIVKGMLEHSRTSSGKKELTDINALADEYLRLSYHGLRAKNKDFNAEMVTNFDPELPKIEVIPQDIGRVFLNLINNAFQACIERSSDARTEPGRSAIKNQGEKFYKPLVSVATQLITNNQLQISITDNGPGIPDSIKDKIFQPFFTTKETGKGTGLGLSLAYDIVKAHGGEIILDSKTSVGTNFIIKLPLL